MKLLAKLSRYTAVSVVAAASNAGLYAGLLTAAWHPVMANVTAATMVTVPTFLVNRRWTWRRRDRRDRTRQGVIYWSFTMVNVALSSSLAWQLDRRGADASVLVTATGLVYATTWVVRFLFLDRVLFRDR